MTSSKPLASFTELYNRHYEAVFRAALRVTGNPADAEDVLQTVFLRVLAQREGAEDLAFPAARRRELRAESDYEDREHAAEPSLLLKERLRRAIAVLDIDDASLFLLRYVEG